MPPTPPEDPPALEAAAAATTDADTVHCPVVGIGASAGGFDALVRLLSPVRSPVGIAFVVLQHLDPTHESHLVDLLGQRVSLPVVQVEDGQRLAVDTVHVLPPNRVMSLRGDHLELSAPPNLPGVRLPIDHFLRTLAEDRHERAIGVILSGAGSDGTMGIRAIKSAGGLVLVQDPETAEHSSMPRSAIATGLVDWVLPAEAIAARLADYIAHPYVRDRPRLAEAPPPSDDDALVALLTLIRGRTPYDFRGYKRATLRRRAFRRMYLLQIETLPAYVDLLGTDPTEVEALVQDMLISVTDFFREPEAWAALEETVIKPLVADAEPGRQLRMWVAGCATGQEAYSLAMVVLDQLYRSHKRCTLRIFATDIDHRALDIARSGTFPQGIAADLEPRWLHRYFVQSNSGYTATAALRESITFAEQNLISDPPFSRLDLICCRNVLIYLEPAVQVRLMGTFHFALDEAGCLFLGSSETVGRQADLFQAISPKHRIYRRTNALRAGGAAFQVLEHGRRVERAPSGSSTRREMRLARLAEQRLVQRFAPAAVLIDQRFEILYFYGPTDPWLKQPVGEPTRNLLARARGGLRGKLRDAVHRVLETRSAVELQAQVRRNDQVVPCRVMVLPVDDAASREILVLVAVEVGDAPEPTPPKPRRPGGDADPSEGADETEDVALVAHLERELDALRNDLNSSIEQLEIANEELQSANEEVMSANEELQSTNEELETSKEELQSLNEELNTVNAQLGAKLEELQAKNDDLTNLLNSTHIPAFCLDLEQNIRWFTPAATSLVRLQSADVGRAFVDITHRFTEDDLLVTAGTVLRTLVPNEREVLTHDARTFLRRALPYRTADGSIGGTVFTFADVTHRRSTEAELRRLNTQLEHEMAQRTELLRFTQDVTAVVNRAGSEAAVLRQAIELICRFRGWPAGQAWLPSADDSATMVPGPRWRASGSTPSRDTAPLAINLASTPEIAGALASREPAWTRPSDGPPTLATVGSIVVLPVVLHGTVTAVLEFAVEGPVEIEPAFQSALSTIAVQLGQASARARTSVDVTTIADREQRRLGQELHDTVSQELAGIAMLIDRLLQDAADAKSPLTERMGALATEIGRAKEHARVLTTGMLTTEVAPDRLASALHALASRVQKLTGTRCTFAATGTVTVSDAATATSLYRIAQEAVHNATKHARAQHVKIQLDADGPRVIVSDDGVGVPADAQNQGRGLRIMQHRADLLGATLQVTADNGTRVECTLRPVRPGDSTG